MGSKCFLMVELRQNLVGTLDREVRQVVVMLQAATGLVAWPANQVAALDIQVAYWAVRQVHREVMLLVGTRLDHLEVMLLAACQGHQEAMLLVGAQLGHPEAMLLVDALSDHQEAMLLVGVRLDHREVMLLVACQGHREALVLVACYMMVVE